MPRVPTYDDPQAAPQNLPDARQQTPSNMMQMADIGPGQQMRLGQAVEGMGNVLAHEAMARQIQASEAQAKDLDTRLMTGIQGILYGAQDDPAAGYLNKVGGEAVNSQKATAQSIADLKDKLSDGIDNESQRQMFANTADMRIRAALDQVNAHAAQQGRVYAAGAAQTRAQVASDAMARAFVPASDTPALNYNPGKPETNTPYQQYLHTVWVEANDLADMQGLPSTGKDADLRTQLINAQMGKAYIGTFNYLIANNQTQAAQAYLAAIDKNKLLDTGVVGALQQKLQSSASVDYMYQYTDKLMQDHPDEAAQRAQIAQDFKDGTINGAQRNMIESRVAQIASAQRTQQSNQAAGALGNASNYAANNPGLSFLDFAKAYPDQYRLLYESDHIETAMNYFNGGNKAGDPALFNNLMDMASTNPSGLLDYPADQIAAKLSPQQLAQVKAARNGIATHNAQQIATDNLVTSTVKSVSKKISDAGVNLNQQTEAGKTDLNALMANLRMKLYTAAGNNNGEPLTDKQANDIALGVLKDQALSGTGYFGTANGRTPIPAYQSPLDARQGLLNIPDADRNAIRNSLIKNGMPVSEANILRLYKMGKGAHP